MAHQMKPVSLRGGESLSYLEVAEAKFDAMLKAIGTGETVRIGRVAELRRLIASWADRKIDARPKYRSFASNDGAPLEFSCAWSRRDVEARVYAEPLDGGLTAGSRQETGRRVTRALALEPGTVLDRYLSVEDIFLGGIQEPVSFCVLHGMMWRSTGERILKLYLNPQVRGLAHAFDVLAEAMSRLGLTKHWHEALRVDRRVRIPFEPIFLALDLNDPDTARTKVYFRHPGATAEEIGAVAADHEDGQTERILSLLTGGRGLHDKPPVTSLTFTVGEPLPSATTLYVPVHPNVPNDMIGRDRVCRLMYEAGIDPASYLATLDALTTGPLSESRVQTYIGYRGGPDPRVSVYFGSNARQSPPV